jgi:hypothetical protein
VQELGLNSTRNTDELGLLENEETTLSFALEEKHKQKKSVKEQTQKIDSPRIFSPYFTHFRKAEIFFFPKKLLHSYLLSKGAQSFYTFAQNSK